MYSGIGRSLGTDYFLIADQLTREELGYLRRTRDFVDNEVLPVINGYWERAEFPWPLLHNMARLGIVGDGIVISEARDLLGGNGILLDFHVMRHMADIEAIHTYEGTETIQTLIVGRDITGASAFT
jgi:hypothetical protein